MDRKKRLDQRHILLFFLFALLWNYPLLGAWNRPEQWLGLPFNLLFLMASWLLLIAVLWRWQREKWPDQPHEPHE